jgi:hypothetical protein
MLPEREPIIPIEAFNVVVRSIVEFSSPVWSPTAVSSIKIKSSERGDGSLNLSEPIQISSMMNVFLNLVLHKSFVVHYYVLDYLPILLAFLTKIILT